MLPGIVAGSLLAAIGIAPALSLTWHEPADIVAEASRIYVFERLPHHLSILSLPSEEVTSRLLRHAAVLVALCIFGYASRRRNSIPPDRSIRVGRSDHRVHRLRNRTGISESTTIAAKFLRYYWFRLTDFAAPMAVALLATSTIAIGLQQHRRWAAALFVAMLAFTGWYLEESCRPRITSLTQSEPPVPPADAKVTFYPDWVKVCDWIAANTPSDALFLTPRLNQSFKWRTGRAEVVNRKDIPQDARGIIEWYNRLKDIYYTNENGIERSYDSIGDRGTDSVRELAKKYHAQYVLMDRGQLLALPIAFQNEEYVVYQIENRKAGNSRRPAGALKNRNAKRTSGCLGSRPRRAPSCPVTGNKHVTRAKLRPPRRASSPHRPPRRSRAATLSPQRQMASAAHRTSRHAHAPRRPNQPARRSGRRRRIVHRSGPA